MFYKKMQSTTIFYKWSYHRLHLKLNFEFFDISGFDPVFPWF